LPLSSETQKSPAFGKILHHMSRSAPPPFWTVQRRQVNNKFNLSGFVESASQGGADRKEGPRLSENSDEFDLCTAVKKCFFAILCTTAFYPSPLTHLIGFFGMKLKEWSLIGSMVRYWQTLSIYAHIFTSLFMYCRSRDSVICIATGYGLDDRGVGVRVPVGSRIFLSPRRPDRLSGSPKLLSNGYRGIFSRG
jgi:hypothetical protein